MSLIKCAFVFLSLVAVSSIVAPAQGEKKDGLPGWDVICVDGIKDGVVIQCPGFKKDGVSYSITRELLINTGMPGSSVSLTLTKTDKDPQRELEIIDVKPARDMEDENQEFWYAVSKNGPGGPDGNLYFLTLRFFCKNPKNSDNGRGGYCANGSYNGTVKFKDSKTGPVQSLTLTVNVTSTKQK